MYVYRIVVLLVVTFLLQGCVTMPPVQGFNAYSHQGPHGRSEGFGINTGWGSAEWGRMDARGYPPPRSRGYGAPPPYQPRYNPYQGQRYAQHPPRRPPPQYQMPPPRRGNFEGERARVNIFGINLDWSRISRGSEGRRPPRVVRDEIRRVRRTP